MIVEALSKSKTNIANLKHLSTLEKESVSELFEFVTELIPATVILYGSKARGDFNADSDIDLLVMTEGITPSIKNTIIRKAKDINELNDLLIITFIPTDFKLFEESTSFRKNVLNDGIILTQ